MSDENDEGLEEGELEEEGQVNDDSLYLSYRNGEIVIFSCAAFAEKFETLALRSNFASGDLEVLSKDGRTWKTLGKPVQAVPVKKP